MGVKTMPSGKIIGGSSQYRTEELIAKGAFSQVYRCTELHSGHSYALKVIRRGRSSKTWMEEALIREVNAMEIAGSSPYVVSLVDKMVSKHNYYIVMDIAEGGTLLDLIREQRHDLKALHSSTVYQPGNASTVFSSSGLFSSSVLQYSTVQRFFKQLLLGLSSLHERNIVHRDLKPENILLNRRRTRVLISDFGFACHAPPGVALTRACGTLKYCAPELLVENPSYDGRKVDVWALGVTLYVMLFGGFPYRCRRSDPEELLEIIRSTPYRIPRQIPAEIEDILRHMLCVEAGDRWTVKQLLQHSWMQTTASDRLSSYAPSEVAESCAALSTATVSPSRQASTAVQARRSITGSIIVEDFPPVDALESESDDRDDGFYKNSMQAVSADDQVKSNSEKENSRSTSSSDSSSGGNRRRAVLSAAEMDTASLPAKSFGVTAGFTGEVGKGSEGGALHGAVAASTQAETPSEMTQDKEGDSASSGLPNTGSNTTVSSPVRREVLRQGDVSTCMTSIDSDGSDISNGDDEEEEDEVGGRGEAPDVEPTGGVSRCSPSFGRDPRPWWMETYTNGALLTAWTVVNFVVLFALSIISVASRLIFSCEVEDLPLPRLLHGFIRPYTRFLRGEQDIPEVAASSLFSPPSLHAIDGVVDSHDIPGYRVRSYVRLAERSLCSSLVDRSRHASPHLVARSASDFSELPDSSLRKDASPRQRSDTMVMASSPPPLSLSSRQNFKESLPMISLLDSPVRMLDDGVAEEAMQRSPSHRMFSPSAPLPSRQKRTPRGEDFPYFSPVNCL